MYGIKSNNKVYHVKCVITDIYDVTSFLLLIINTLNGTFESIVMKIALTEIVCSYLVNKM